MAKEINGQMTIFDLLDNGFGLSTEEKIKKYLFETHRVCCFGGWFEEVKSLYLKGVDILTAVRDIFSRDSEWSNVIFPYKDLDFSELEKRRVGVKYSRSGIEINYDGTYMEKKKWKKIRMDYQEVVDEIEKII